MGFFNKLTGVNTEEENPKKKKKKIKEEKEENKQDKIKIQEVEDEVEEEVEDEDEEEDEDEDEVMKDKELNNEESESEEGQLAIDVYETDDDFVIQSTIAGVKAEDLDISIEDDMVTIRGERQHEEEKKEKGKYYYKECYWGSFSRQVILPEEVEGSKAQASMKDGVLTLKIPKIKKTKKRKISVKQEE